MTDERNVAVVGGGLAGLKCANRLAGRGLSVSVIDKARGPGGRLAHRRAQDPRDPQDSQGRPFRFHHGCPWFVADGPHFGQELELWEQRRVAQRWPGRVADADGRDVPGRRWVGLPSMSGPCKYLSEGIDYRPRRRVTAMRRAAGRWMLDVDGGEPIGGFDRVALAVPAPQAADLLRTGGLNDLADRLKPVEMAAQWAAMLAYDAPPDAGAEALILGDGPLDKAWQTPGEPRCWTVLATTEWTAPRLEDTPEHAAAALAEAFAEHVGARFGRPVHVAGHRWRYSRCVRPLGEGRLWDADAGVGLCGDWLLGDSAEHAYDSGCALAEAVGDP